MSGTRPRITPLFRTAAAVRRASSEVERLTLVSTAIIQGMLTWLETFIAVLGAYATMSMFFKKKWDPKGLVRDRSPAVHIPS